MYFDKMNFKEIVEVIESVDDDVVVFCSSDEDRYEFLKKMDELGYEWDRRECRNLDLYYNNRIERSGKSASYVVHKQDKTMYIADWQIVWNYRGIDPIEYKKDEVYKQVDLKEAMEHFQDGGTIKHNSFGYIKYFDGRHYDSLIDSRGSAMTVDEVLEGEWYIKVRKGECKVSSKKRVEELERVLEEKRTELEHMFGFANYHHQKNNINLIDIGFRYRDKVIVNPFIYGKNPINFYGDSFIHSRMADMILEYYA